MCGANGHLAIPTIPRPHFWLTAWINLIGYSLLTLAWVYQSSSVRSPSYLPASEDKQVHFFAGSILTFFGQKSLISVAQVNSTSGNKRG